MRWIFWMPWCMTTILIASLRENSVNHKRVWLLWVVLRCIHSAFTAHFPPLPLRPADPVCGFAVLGSTVTGLLPVQGSHWTPSLPCAGQTLSLRSEFWIPFTFVRSLWYVWPVLHHDLGDPCDTSMMPQPSLPPPVLLPQEPSLRKECAVGNVVGRLVFKMELRNYLFRFDRGCFFMMDNPPYWERLLTGWTFDSRNLFRQGIRSWSDREREGGMVRLYPHFMCCSPSFFFVHVSCACKVVVLPQG